MENLSDSLSGSNNNSKVLHLANVITFASSAGRNRVRASTHKYVEGGFQARFVRMTVGAALHIRTKHTTKITQGCLLPQKRTSVVRTGVMLCLHTKNKQCQGSPVQTTANPRRARQSQFPACKSLQHSQPGAEAPCYRDQCGFSEEFRPEKPAVWAHFFLRRKPRRE